MEKKRSDPLPFVVVSCWQVAAIHKILQIFNCPEAFYPRRCINFVSLNQANRGYDFDIISLFEQLSFVICVNIADRYWLAFFCLSELVNNFTEDSVCLFHLVIGAQLEEVLREHKQPRGRWLAHFLVVDFIGKVFDTGKSQFISIPALSYCIILIVTEFMLYMTFINLLVGFLLDLNFETGLGYESVQDQHQAHVVKFHFKFIDL